MAILLAEVGLLPLSILLGTDCRSEAVVQACAGLYSAAAVGPLPPGIRRKYFVPTGGAGTGFWQLIEPLRRQTRWAVADLAKGIAEGPWDVVLWRNLAIYLNPEAVENLWNRVAEALAPGGFLIVGKAERPPAGLGLVPVCRCIYRKENRTCRQGRQDARTTREEV